MTTRVPYQSGIRKFDTGEEVRILPGRKGPGDQLVKWDTHGLQPVRMEFIVYAVAAIMRNEDRLYPPPRRGAQMFLDVFRRALEVGEEQAVREYRLRGVEWESVPTGAPEPGLWDGEE
jgi:hypothetical protein